MAGIQGAADQLSSLCAAASVGVDGLDRPGDGYSAEKSAVEPICTGHAALLGVATTFLIVLPSNSLQIGIMRTAPLTAQAFPLRR